MLYNAPLIVFAVDKDGVFTLSEGRGLEDLGLKPGQVIVLVSDGLWEARNHKGEMFGKEPIYQIIRQVPNATAGEILTACFNRFNVFLGERAPEDDVTLVVIRITKN